MAVALRVHVPPGECKACAHSKIPPLGEIPKAEGDSTQLAALVRGKSQRALKMYHDENALRPCSDPLPTQGVLCVSSIAKKTDSRHVFATVYITPRGSLTLLSVTSKVIFELYCITVPRYYSMDFFVHCSHAKPPRVSVARRNRLEQ